MLTESHYALKKHVQCQDRKTYKLHMCGLCHALGDAYGLTSRLLTMHDMILLNLLTSAQQPTAPAVIERRCPLNPLMKVRTNNSSGSQFAAAASVALGAASLQDHIEDSDGRDLFAQLGRWWMNGKQAVAEQLLAQLGFDPAPLRALPAAQSHAERDAHADPAAPTASIAAALFGMTATLAEAPHNAPALALAGTHYGTFIYLADAHRDLSRDLQRGDFNPLRAFADGGKLSDEGVRWLAARISAALEGVRAALAQVDFARDAATVRGLLTRPLEELLAKLGVGELAPACSTCAPTASRIEIQSMGDKRKRRKRSHDDGVASCCCDVSCCCCLDCDCGDCDCNCCSCDCD